MNNDRISTLSGASEFNVIVALTTITYSWVFCLGSIVLHMTGVHDRNADIVALTVSSLTFLLLLCIVAFKRW